MNRWAAGAAAGALGLGALGAAHALQQEARPEPRQTTAAADRAVTTAPATGSSAAPPEQGADDDASALHPHRAAPALPHSRDATPMTERVATLGLLNKRNGLARDLTLRPGQAVRVGDVIVRLRACEETENWEPQQLTGAFVQIDVRGRDAHWRRAFSGWLYKESPSLNVVEHPVYDVWTKACAMKHPDIGPDTIVAGTAAAAGAVASGTRSSAKKSPAPAPAPAPDAPTPSAASSSPT